MAEITLTLHNKTPIEVTFDYNERSYEVASRKMSVVRVDAGHRISVYPPDGARATRQKILVEFEYHIYDLKKSAIVECTLVGWQLSLQIRPDII